MEFSIPIKYKNFNGFLDQKTNKVKFYNIIYENINHAVSLESNVEEESQKPKLPKPFIMSLRRCK